MIKLIVLTATLAFSLIQIGCSPAKPSNDLIMESIKNTIRKQNQRYAVCRSSALMVASIKSIKTKGEVTDTIVDLKLTNGVLKQVNAVPTYISDFIVITQFKKGDYLEKDSFPGQATFELYDKGWKLISYN
jgi:hypothetical protein